MSTFKHRCIDGISADKKRCREMVEKGIGLVTALSPELGYEVCSELAKEALITDKGIFELVLEKNLLSKERLDKLLDPENMIRPRK